MFNQIISLENLFDAAREFAKGKMSKRDVQECNLNLEDTIFKLHHKLQSGTWRHGCYQRFQVRDPKLRTIHKAPVADRILHHGIMRVIEEYFDKQFIFDSFASRKNKGVHAAINRFQKLAWKLSRNNTKTVWVLQCDIRKFFDSIDHAHLLKLLSKQIKDERLMALLCSIVTSFECAPGSGTGIPLGNYTSQLFANVYMNELDQYIKRDLRVKSYIRYMDDFILLSRNKSELEEVLRCIATFLQQKLVLHLHPNKVTISKWHNGIDFLGYVHYPHHRVLRTKTKKRMLARINKKNKSSYLGLLSHCRTRSLRLIALRLGATIASINNTH